MYIRISDQRRFFNMLRFQMPLGMANLMTPGFLRRSAAGKPGDLNSPQSGNAVGMAHVLKVKT